MAKGFFTDTTLCIGCKACEVACKEWNQLPADGYELTGMSYDNTVALGATTWRHVAFIEQFGGSGTDGASHDGRANGRVNGHAPTFRDGASAVSQNILQAPRLVDTRSGGFLGQNRWLMMSDVCKHCTHAGCLDACPTGAIIRNEFDDVYVQPDICNGCGYCVSACPFGVIDLQKEDGRAWKCTLCYDRQKDGFEPACAKACPTQSILFGELDELKERAHGRVGMLHERGVTDAYLYGADENTSVGNLNAFFLLVDKPEVYNLPENPHVPQAQVIPSYVATAVTAIALGAATALAFMIGGRRA
ncbi:MAG TPA: 4Fe-4S dicluster domain-containing protein [Ktedonobacterales bacterium]|nr:4Fe-4S dicluster domain-containing protein [Ktedonobacterales bacterium]